MKWYYYIPGVSWFLSLYWEWQCRRGLRKAFERMKTVYR